MLTYARETRTRKDRPAQSDPFLFDDLTSVERGAASSKTTCPTGFQEALYSLLQYIRQKSELSGAEQCAAKC